MGADNFQLTCVQIKFNNFNKNNFSNTIFTTISIYKYTSYEMHSKAWLVSKDPTVAPH